MDPEHPDVAMSLNNLAEFYLAQGHYAKVEPLMRRALTVFLVGLGSEHPSSHSVMKNYERLLHAMGKTGAEIFDILQSLVRSAG